MEGKSGRAFVKFFLVIEAKVERKVRSDMLGVRKRSKDELNIPMLRFPVADI